MTMPNKRLDYEPLKAVLESLEPNVRIQLALRAPSLRLVEKLVPMKIEHLAAKDNKIVINDTTYTAGIYRHYHNLDETLLLDRKENENGGFQHEIDKWGFRTDPYADRRTKGDIAVRSVRWNWQEGNPGKEREFRLMTAVFREAMRRRVERDGLEPLHIIPELRDPPNSNQLFAQNAMQIQQISRKPLRELQSLMDFQYKLLPFYYRRNNISPPFTPYIQLTVEGPNGKIIERIDRSKRLCEAVKYLNTRFFGGRRHSIRVKELSLVKDSYILRFTSDMKIRVRQIQSRSINFKKLKGLTDPANYSLEVLTVERKMEEANTFDHDAVKSAKKLVIFNHFYQGESWIPLVQNMKNQCIILRNQTELHVRQHYVALVENWIGSERTSGTELTIGFRKQETVMELLGLIGNQFEVLRMSERFLTLVMTNGSRLQISCARYENEPGFKNNAKLYIDDVEYKSDWALKLVVV